MRVLAVCTGNVCRSPAVERLLGTWLGPAGIEVRSAGTHALVGAPMSEPMAALVAGAGGRPEGFAARQLTEALLAESDLVLALTTAHRAAVVEAYPRALRTAFTLRELARLGRALAPDALAPGLAADRLRALVPLALAARSEHPAAPGDDDVEDPYRRGEEVYRRSFGQLLPAVHTLLEIAVG